MDGKWSLAGIPHRVVDLYICQDLGPPGTVCEMCETQNIRYVYLMECPDYSETYPSLRLQTRNAPPSSPSNRAARIGSAKLGSSSCTLK